MEANLTVEDALRQIADRAAMLRYLAEGAYLQPGTPDENVMSGIGDVCGDIEQLARSTKAALEVDALGVELKVRRPR